MDEWSKARHAELYGKDAAEEIQQKIVNKKRLRAWNCDCATCKPPTEQTEERKTDSMIVTVIAIRKPSLLEQQAGTGDVILAGPTALSAADRLSAVAQFGAKNADAINKAPAGLLVIELREGV